MALIPDKAIDNQAEVSGGAWRLYCFLARCRNQRTGKCCPSVSTIESSIQIKRRQVFALKAELQAAGWAKFNGSDVTELYGFESAENRTVGVENSNVSEDSSALEPESAENCTTGGAENRTVQKIALHSAENCTDECRKMHSKVQKNALAYKEEPAKEPAKLTSKVIPSASPKVGRIADPLFAIFAEEFQAAKDMPYLSKQADFVQLATLKKKSAASHWDLTPERFTRAVRNFLASDLGNHTLADLASRFSAFYGAPLDRFGKAIPINGLESVGSTGTLAQLPDRTRKNVSAVAEFLQGRKANG